MNSRARQVHQTMEDFSSREFPMLQSDFDQIRKIAYQRTGIKLTNQKKTMVYGRLSRRLRALGIKTFAEYCRLIKDESSPEFLEFTNSITTNLTSFFRENHHFEYLKSTVIPGLLQSNRANKRIRIWSAGCSTGEEPYSIAMVLSSIPELQGWDVKVLATDLDSNVVAKAKSGVYSGDRTTNIPPEYCGYFESINNGSDVRISQGASSFITFKKLNLLHQWPMKGPFDVIFCRNVVIYFDVETQKELFSRYASIIGEHGHLFIGHSESLKNISDEFMLVNKTVYRKIV